MVPSGRARAGGCLTAILMTAGVFMTLLIVLCAVAVWFVRRGITVTSDPAQVRRMTAEITRASLPERFQPLAAVKIGAFGASMSVVLYSTQETIAEIGPEVTQPSDVFAQAEQLPIRLIMVHGRAPGKRGRFRSDFGSDALLSDYQVKEVRLAGLFNGRPTTVVVRCYTSLNRATKSDKDDQPAEGASDSGSDAASPNEPNPPPSTSLGGESAVTEGSHTEPAKSNTDEQQRSAGDGDADAEQDVLSMVEVDRSCDLFEVQAVQRTSNSMFGVYLRDEAARFDLDLVREILRRAR